MIGKFVVFEVRVLECEMCGFILIMMMCLFDGLIVNWML